MQIDTTIAGYQLSVGVLQVKTGIAIYISNSSNGANSIILYKGERFAISEAKTYYMSAYQTPAEIGLLTMPVGGGGGGGGGGISTYADLPDKPSIAGHTLEGDSTLPDISIDEASANEITGILQS